MPLPRAIPRPPTLLAAAAVALALAGCADESTGPAAVPEPIAPSAVVVCCSDGGGGGGGGGGGSTPTNAAPVITPIDDVTVPEGSTATLTVSATDPEGGALTYFWDLDNDDDYELSTGAVASASFPVPDDGTFTYQVFAQDAAGSQTKATGRVIGTNVAPTVEPIANQTVEAGQTLTFTITATDPGAGDLAGSMGWNVKIGGSLLVYQGGPSVTVSRSFATPGVYAGWAAVLDDAAAVSEQATFTVTVVAPVNVAPEIATLGLPGAPVALGTPVSLAATFTDADADDTHTASIDWGDGQVGAGLVNGATAPRSVSASHDYMEPGVYRVTLTVTDDAGASDEVVHQYVVVYDPTAGFVTGGGWIAYGADSCTICGGAAGRGEFGFVSRYKKGASVPAGNTRFEFHAGTLRFTSTAYEWLVVAGRRAQFKGRGTMDGAGDYGFLVTAVDGSPDAFRIKIWDRSTGATVFDNQMGADDGDGGAATLLDRVNGTGSIVIHAK